MFTFIWLTSFSSHWATVCHSCSNFLRLAEPLEHVCLHLQDSSFFHHHRDRYRSLVTAKTIRDISIALKAHNSFWWRGPATKPFHLGNVFTDGNFQTTVCCLFLIRLLQIPLCVASPPSDHSLHPSIAVFFSLLEMSEKALVWSNGPPVEMYILWRRANF